MWNRHCVIVIVIIIINFIVTVKTFLRQTESPIIPRTTPKTSIPRPKNMNWEQQRLQNSDVRLFMEQSMANVDVHLTFNLKRCTKWTRNLGVGLLVLTNIGETKAPESSANNEFLKTKNSFYSWRRSIPQSKWSSVASRSCSSACTVPSSWQCRSDSGENNGEVNKDIKEHICHLQCLPRSSLSHWAVGEKGN